MTQWVVLDYETASACDLKKAGAWRYAEDPTTEIITLRYQASDQNSPDVRRWLPPGVNWIEHDGDLLLRYVNDPAFIFVAQNAQFEKAMWREHMVKLYDFPNIPNSRWHCTMSTAAMKRLPLDLEKRAIALRLAFQKDREGSAITKSLSKANKKGEYDRSVETLRRVDGYCETDIRTEVEDFKLLGFLPADERKVWLLDQRINERGIKLDLPFIKAAQRVVNDATVPLAKEFQKITGGLTFTQRDKIMGWLDAEGVRLPDMRKETLTAILGAPEGEDDADSDIEQWDIAMPGHVRRALEIRQLIGSSSVKKLARMDACVSSDGRARGTMQYHGAGPGRWAGRLFQPHNFPRGIVRVGEFAPDPSEFVAAILTGDFQYVEALYGPAVQAVVSALRHAIIPANGRALCVGDFAGIEARLVLALAGQHDKTALMASGVDVYCDMASKIFRRVITKKDVEERQFGKNSVLGLGFQMGWKKFKLKYAKEHPDEFAQNIVRVYRKEWAPKVPYLWYGLEEAACRAVWDGTAEEAYGIVYRRLDNWLTCRLPSGRLLWYYNPKPVKKPAPWDADEIRPAWYFHELKMGVWRATDAYGGILAENVVQAMARDILVAAMFKCEENNLPVVLTVHDEIVTEPEERNADPKALQQIMSDVPAWVKAIQAPVAAETWTGDRYKK